MYRETMKEYIYFAGGRKNADRINIWPTAITISPSL